MLLLTLLLLLMLVVMPMPMREVLWERLGCSTYTCFRVFGSCWEPLGASGVFISRVFTCLGAAGSLWELPAKFQRVSHVWGCLKVSGSPRMPKDAQGLPRRPFHTCCCVSERAMTLIPLCFTVPERPQEVPGGSFTLNPICFTVPERPQEPQEAALYVPERPRAGEAPGGPRGGVLKEKTRQK